MDEPTTPAVSAADDELEDRDAPQGEGSPAEPETATAEPVAALGASDADAPTPDDVPEDDAGVPEVEADDVPEPEAEVPEAEPDDVPEPEAEVEEAAPAPEPVFELPDNARWYVVHTYSGYENKVKRNLEHRIESMGMLDRIYQVVVPVEEEVDIKDGQRRIVDGPFTDFHGVVDTIDMDRGKVRLMVSFFGRDTPVELDFLQVDKM